MSGPGSCAPGREPDRAPCFPGEGSSLGRSPTHRPHAVHPLADKPARPQGFAQSREDGEVVARVRPSATA